MFSDLKSCIPKKLKRLAMLPEEIPRVVNTTRQKLRQMIQTFEEALHSPVSYSRKVWKSNDEFRLTEWEYDCSAVPNMFLKSVKQDIQDIITYTHQLGMAPEFNSKDIKLSLKAVTKHF